MKREELAKKTKQELMEIAKDVGLVGRSRMKKDELVSSISRLLKAKGPLKTKERVEKKKGRAAKAAPAEAGKVETLQERIEETKFYLGAQEKAFLTEEELPEGYGDNRVVLMVRDPYWAYAYWEINSRKVEEAKRGLKSEFDQSRLILRVYDVTGIDFDGTNAHSFFDIEVPNLLGNWYVNLGRPNRSFCLDIGYRKPDGGIFVLSRSNRITSPRDRLSEVIDEEWMGEERIYAVSTGIPAGASAELAEMMKRRMEKEMASPGAWKKIH
jgi:hypothetical protein